MVWGLERSTHMNLPLKGRGLLPESRCNMFVHHCASMGMVLQQGWMSLIAGVLCQYWEFHRSTKWAYTCAQFGAQPLSTMFRVL